MMMQFESFFQLVVFRVDMIQVDITRQNPPLISNTITIHTLTRLLLHYLIHPNPLKIDSSTNRI